MHALRSMAFRPVLNLSQVSTPMAARRRIMKIYVQQFKGNALIAKRLIGQLHITLYFPQ